MSAVIVTVCSFLRHLRNMTRLELLQTLLYASAFVVCLGTVQQCIDACKCSGVDIFWGTVVQCDTVRASNSRFEISSFVGDIKVFCCHFCNCILFFYSNYSSFADMLCVPIFMQLLKYSSCCLFQGLTCRSCIQPYFCST